MKAIRILILLFFLWLLITECSLAQPSLAANWKNFVVKIMKGGHFGFTKSHGTGFVVSHGDFGLFLVTNKHIVGSRDSLYVIINDYDTTKTPPILNPYQEIIPLKDSLGLDLWKGHPDSSVDVAVIKIDLINFKFVKTINSINLREVANFEELKTGEFVYFFGFPLEVKGAKETGIISIVRAGYCIL